MVRCRWVMGTDLLECARRSGSLASREDLLHRSRVRRWSFTPMCRRATADPICPRTDSSARSSKILESGDPDARLTCPKPVIGALLHSHSHDCIRDRKSANEVRRVVLCVHSSTASPNMSTTMTVRLENDVKDRLDVLAEATQRSKSFLAAEAIRSYVENNEWQIGEIQAALKEADARDFASDKDVTALAKKWKVNAG